MFGIQKTKQNCKEKTVTHPFDPDVFQEHDFKAGQLQ